MAGARSLLCLLLLLSLSGCASLLDPKQFGQDSPFSFLNTYEAALNDYNKGRIMMARDRVLAMDKTRDDYPAALKLLRTKIDPARLRLLRHYTRKAREAERTGEWFRAMGFYAQAASLNTTPKALEAKSREMEMKMRQLRMDTLIAQRREEDSQLLAWLNAYEPPKGIDTKDDAFERSREHVQDMVEEQASFAYGEARRFLSKKQPEIAYVEAESYARLAPDSSRAQSLMADVKEKMPKGIRVVPLKSSSSRDTSSKRMVMPETVKRAQVLELIRQGEWVKAKKYALVYRREGGKDADRLLKQIQSSTESEAAVLFRRGRLAFRKEQLKQAIVYWEKAVALVPENGEYAAALQRARQLQDQLRVLRETESEKAK